MPEKYNIRMICSPDDRPCSRTGILSSVIKSACKSSSVDRLRPPCDLHTKLKEENELREQRYIGSFYESLIALKIDTL